MIPNKIEELRTPWQKVDHRNWNLTQVKYHYDVVLGKMLQNKALSSEDIKASYLKAKHIQWNKVSIDVLPKMWASSLEIENLQVKKGDLFVCEGGEVGRAAILATQPPDNCIIQNALHLVRPKSTGDLRFLRYLLQHASSHYWFDVLCNRSTIAHFTTEKFNDMWIWVPPLDDQRAIADFLDRETAIIDELIAAKERLLVLLAEKRRALITQAVTRGLTPDVSLKDSGVERLGEIPTHWEMVKLKHLGKVRTGVAKGRQFGYRETVSVPYLRVANVQDGYLDLSDVAEIEVLPEEVSSFSLKKGDVLMNEGGDADKLGRGAVWDGSISPCIHQNHVFAVRCFDVEPFWLTTVTGTDYAKAYFESHSKQSTNLASISSANLKELPIVIPPRQEQKIIVKYLERAISNLDNLRIAAKRTVNLLHERRTAMIAAAVSGHKSVT